MVKTVLPLQGAWVLSLVREVLHACRYGQKKKRGNMIRVGKIYGCLLSKDSLGSEDVEAIRLQLAAASRYRLKNSWWCG